MQMFWRILISTAALLATAAAQPAAVENPADRVRAHVEYLASDQLRGRDTGSVGHAQAADYVARQFQALGLKPGGPGGSWLQQVPFRRAVHSSPPAITMSAGGKRVRLVSGRDFALQPSVTERYRDIDAGLVFAGHGIHEPTLGIDEYAGLDVRGKLVVVLRGVPSGLPQEIADHLEASKERTAAERGAAGIIELSYGGYNPVSGRALWPLLDWADSAGQAGVGPLRRSLTLSPELSRRIFDGAPQSLDRLRSASSRPIRGFPLSPHLRIRAASQWQEFQSPNVVGVLPGSDPALAAEHVLLLAHLDHLGVEPGARNGEDAIYNGVIDNAAGVAALIEAARGFVASGRPPRRSVTFVATTGEERGLLGADYFAAHPPVGGTVVAAVNFDMPLITYDFTDVVGLGADHSTLGGTLAEAGQGMGIAVSPDPMPEQSLFIRSDHYRFVLRGVPAIFLMTGHANGGKDEWSRYFGRNYHRTGDDVTQRIDWEAGAKFSQINFRVARLLADAPERPRWYRGDYFGDRYAPGQPRAER